MVTKPIRTRSVLSVSSGRRTKSRSRLIGLRKNKNPKDALWVRFQKTRSIKARNSLIEQYRGFVRDVARRFSARLPKSVDLDDLEVAGIFGLMNAIQHYDPDRGVRFETYCEMRVRGSILDELRTQDWLPRQWRSRIAKRDLAIDSLRVGLGREPTEEEISGEMGIPHEEYKSVYGNLIEHPTVQVRGEDSRNPESDPAVDSLEDPRPESPFDDMCRRELYNVVDGCLNNREREIVYLRYFEEMTMREIGRILGLSESRVYKIHARLLDRIKKRFAGLPEGKES